MPFRLLSAFSRQMEQLVFQWQSIPVLFQFFLFPKTFKGTPLRERMRSCLFDFIKNNHKTGIQLNREKILDLGSLPGVDGAHISLSHTLGAGAFAIYFKDKTDVAESICSLGVDVEVRGRVSERLASRISCNEEEVKKSLHPDFLWTAKEAAFKAMSAADSPCGMNSIFISDYLRLETHTPFFRCSDVKKEEDVFEFLFSHVSTRRKGKGLVLGYGGFVLSLAFLFSNTD